MVFRRSIRSFLSHGFLEFTWSKPQSFTKSQYNWYTVAPLDITTTRHNHPTPLALSFSYATLAPAANIAETYFPRLTRWLVCPSSNQRLAHWKPKNAKLCYDLLNKIQCKWYVESCKFLALPKVTEYYTCIALQ